jgi:hypothetical protein
MRRMLDTLPLHALLADRCVWSRVLPIVICVLRTYTQCALV